MTAAAEIYDPATSTWSLTGSLERCRYRHTGNLLPTGDVLIAGGSANNPNPIKTASSELYVSTGTEIELFESFTLTAVNLHFDELEQRDEVHVNGDFTLGASSDGIDPLTEVVIVAVGSRRLIFPPGVFILAGDVYSATKSSAPLVEVTITPLSGSDYQWSVTITEFQHRGIHNPLNIAIRIFDDFGQISERITGDLLRL